MVLPGPFPSVQGTQVFVRDLAVRLAGGGVDVRLLVYGPPQPLFDSDFPVVIYRTAETTAHSRKSGPNWHKPGADVRLWKLGNAIIDSWRPDVLHLHNFEALAAGALWRYRVPILGHVHGRLRVELPSYFRSRAIRCAAKTIGSLFDSSLGACCDEAVVFSDDAARRLPGGVSRTVVFPQLLYRKVATSSQPRNGILYAGNADHYQNLPVLADAAWELYRMRVRTHLTIASHEPAERFLSQCLWPPTTLFVHLSSFHELCELTATMSDCRLSSANGHRGCRLKC